MNGDGCSSACSVETNFTCYPTNSTTPGSDCYYTGDITITVVYIAKTDGLNQVQILFDIQPNSGSVLSTLNFMDIIQITNAPPIDSYSVVQNADGTVTMIINYSTDIQNQPMTVTVDPTLSNNTLFSKMDSATANFAISPANNQGAYAYDTSDYSLALSISQFATAVAILALLMYFLSIIAGKMVGVEMMAVLQITFFSLLTLSHMNPCFSALSYLWLANGYNSLKHNHLADPLSPIPVKGIQMFSRFA